MAVTPVESAEGRIIDYGDKVRIEQRAHPVKRVPVVDPKTKEHAKTPTGEIITTHIPFHADHTGHDDTGQPIFEVPKDKEDAELVYPWVLYKLVENKEHPAAPGSKQHAHHGAITTESHTWMFVADGTKEEMQAEAEKLAATL